jgi:hypothetical protein
MTSTSLRERLAEGEFDVEEYYDALAYVRDDGRRRPSR